MWQDIVRLVLPWLLTGGLVAFWYWMFANLGTF
jgi:hypothetical protein